MSLGFTHDGVIRRDYLDAVFGNDIGFQSGIDGFCQLHQFIPRIDDVSQLRKKRIALWAMFSGLGLNFVPGFVD